MTVGASNCEDSDDEKTTRAGPFTPTPPFSSGAKGSSLSPPSPLLLRRRRHKSTAPDTKNTPTRPPRVAPKATVSGESERGALPPVREEVKADTSCCSDVSVGVGRGGGT